MTQEQTPQFRAAELATHMARAFPQVSVYRIASFITAAQKLAKKAKRHAERMCSEQAYASPWTDQDTGDDIKAPKIQAKADKLVRDFMEGAPVDLVGENAPAFPISLETGGDPRGPCCILHITGQRGDGMGEGFAVY